MDRPDAQVPAPLAGRVALVTGSTAGLGKVIAFELAEAGAAVVLNYQHDEARARACFSAFEAAGHCGLLVRASAIDAQDIDRLNCESCQALGSIDIVVVNASPEQPFKPIEDHSWADYQTMLDFFVKSPYLLARALVPAMKAKRWGRWINIGSEVFDQGTPNMSAYVAAKGAQLGWTRSMARELAAWDITVNMVAPGWIPVERHEQAPAEVLERYRAQVPLGRWGTPRDVSNAVLEFASPRAGFVTGQVRTVNGGLTFG